MNDLQKKFAIVGLTAFIVWLIMAINNNAFANGSHPNHPQSFLNWFTNRAIYFPAPNPCPHCTGLASLVNLSFFTTWLGSLIAFFIYKD